MASLLLHALAASSSTVTQTVLPTALASSYGLTTSTSLAMPTASLASTSVAAYVQTTWGVKGTIDGTANMAFVADPFPSSTSLSASSSAKPTSTPVPTSTTSHTPTSSSTRLPNRATVRATPAPTPSPTPAPAQVLRVTYPAGSYAHPGTAGAQFYVPFPAAPASKPWQRMLLAYDVAFDPSFAWVQGGKLPGLRGGANTTGCSGGQESDGASCFSARLMWRAGAAGEVYAYTLSPAGQCANADFICHNNGDGTSIDRGSFHFQPGAWQTVALLIELNQPVSSADGVVALYYNNQKALQENTIQYRNSSALNAGGLFFSTFYGGSTADYAPNATQHAYFRNFKMWASS